MIDGIVFRSSPTAFTSRCWLFIPNGLLPSQDTVLQVRPAITWLASSSTATLITWALTCFFFLSF